MNNKIKEINWFWKNWTEDEKRIYKQCATFTVMCILFVFRLPNNFEDDTEITTPTVDIKKLESEVIEAERIASEARAEADRLTAIANEKRAALEAARQ